uniref:Large ribosomal subunit protein bL21c n=1 Tax=Alsidium seaforthii TaxID=2007182 RepID=A0A1Z1MD31_9FLOR|nr:ribosomal protein L21 [Bryothamnion seaforthii]ARW63853.1 ribosomal protein L21 [Bryothamnion seaforthii]
MVYAVVDTGGNQIIVEPGKFYDINYICADPGDIINLNRVLFLAKSNRFSIGRPCLEDIIVRVKILKHVKAKKLTIFKIKPKKNARLKKGHRQKLTRILVEEITLAKFK